VGTRPWRAVEAEKVLVGRAPDAAAFRAAAAAAVKGASPKRYNNFKVELAQRTIVRALSTVRT
jgi:xanthine dehydrogenase YagS FAD-binding subunit